MPDASPLKGELRGIALMLGLLLLVLIAMGIGRLPAVQQELGLAERVASSPVKVGDPVAVQLYALAYDVFLLQLSPDLALTSVQRERLWAVLAPLARDSRLGPPTLRQVVAAREAVDDQLFYQQLVFLRDPLLVPAGAAEAFVQHAGALPPLDALDMLLRSGGGR